MKKAGGSESEIDVATEAEFEVRQRKSQKPKTAGSLRS